MRSSFKYTKMFQKCFVLVCNVFDSIRGMALYFVLEGTWISKSLRFPWKMCRRTRIAGSPKPLIRIIPTPLCSDNSTYIFRRPYIPTTQPIFRSPYIPTAMPMFWHLCIQPLCFDTLFLRIIDLITVSVSHKITHDQHKGCWNIGASELIGLLPLKKPTQNRLLFDSSNNFRVHDPIIRLYTHSKTERRLITCIHYFKPNRLYWFMVNTL